MTSRVKVIAPDGSVMQARALLDCAALTSLVTEHLAQKLHLPRCRSNFTINGVAGIDVRPRGTVSFKVAGVQSGGKQIEIEASVLPKVTVDLPTLPVSPVTRWKPVGPGVRRPRLQNSSTGGHLTMGKGL